MDIYPLQIPKALLDAAPENERILYLMAGQLANDLNILSNLAIIVMNPVSGHEIFARARTATTMLFLKLLAGKVNEGWKLFGQKLSPLYPKYEADFDDAAKQRLDELKKYFGKSNVVHIVRNKAGFHSDTELISRGYASFPDTEVFVDYFSETPGHCLYFSAELISVVGMTHVINESDWRMGLTRIADEICGIAERLGRLLIEYMRVFLEKYLTNSVNDINVTMCTIPDGPPIDTVTIPFFCAPPRNWSEEPQIDE